MIAGGVVCVGHAAYDILFPLDTLPPKDTKAMISVSYESAGGPAYNAAALIAKWGLPCALAAVVGRDPYGDRALADLRALGADVSLVRRDPDAPTPLSVVLSAADDGSRTIVTRKAPMAPLDGAAVLAALPFAPACILADGHESEAAAALAQAFPDLPFVLDAGSPRPGVERLVPLATHCIVSERYAASLLGASKLADDAVDAALDLLCAAARRATELGRRGAGLCAVTLGRRGCRYRVGGGSAESLAAFTVPVVDSTGAGDIFHGAAAYALALGKDGRAALTLASAAAAISVGRRGGFASIPELSEAELLQAAGRAL